MKLTITLLLLLSFPFLRAHAAFIDIKPIQVCDDAGTTCAGMNFFENFTDKIWAQAGIDINFLSSAQILETDWLDVDIDSNPANGELDNEAIAMIDYADANINDSNATLAINMFFVDLLDSSAGFFGLGCGAPIYAAFCVNRTGIFISDNIFDINRYDTIAHEIGHVIGLTHGGFGAGGAENLMTSGGSRSVPTSLNDISPDGLGLSNLTDAQIAEVYNSRFVQEMPEPATWLLMMAMTALFIPKRRTAC
ncbi:hypothetical protein LJ739_05510 [Aestuariibacter halophilus]|uniref:PEP-CTERM protein-sorting domain-containing protein n=1 Tax=Fluctibacter halophilus TaxID=226011 RepID=A0ABS8G529_9ALTE|nr:zinc-dependent metalloprotease family protein [Aestuariibacter halophilus]MCC2615692.1 hypothetical protein [Aestuariibacter halophilus]